MQQFESINLQHLPDQFVIDSSLKGDQIMSGFLLACFWITMLSLLFWGGLRSHE